MMQRDLAFSLVTGVVLMVLVVLTRWRWRGGKAVPAATKLPRAQRAPTPFAGLTQKPACPAWAQEARVPLLAAAPSASPPRMRFIRGRRRHVEPTGHVCPYAACAYHGRVGWGNRRATGQPNGRRWRQLYCLGCGGYFLETSGTPLPGKQVEPDTLVWARAALAAGLGIRAVARVCEGDPTTVLGGLVEAAEHVEAFSRYHLHALHVEQVPRDAFFALLSAVKGGEGSAAEAMKRLSRSPHWVWVAMAPVCKLLLAVDVGERPLAMAQRLVHQVPQVLAPHCAPLFLTAGLRDYLTALLTHYGQWMHPERHQATGPQPTPRWMPLPGLLYAQGVKSYRRRRLVGGTHRVIFGPAATSKSIRATRGWKINTSFIERLNLDFRQHGAAIGRRVNTLCKHEAGVRQQLALLQAYHNFVLPHASLRLPLPEPMPGMESGKRWRQRTPAMAAGLTEPLGSLREVLMFRVPPWPQPLAE